MSTCTQNKALTRKDQTLTYILNKTWRASKHKAAGTQEKDVPSKSRVGEKSSDNELKVGTAPVCSAAQELSGVFSGSRMGQQNVDLK